jgi:uncharacterized protein (DUF983 family)
VAAQSSHEMVGIMTTCIHCGFEVFWAFARKDDPCIECGKPIGMKLPDYDMLEDDRGTKWAD